MTATTRRRTAQVAVLVGVLILLVWVLLDPHPIANDPAKPERPAVQAVTAGSVLKPKPCYRPASGPFTPTKVTVPGVTRDATVLALPRDGNNVPSAPPISSVGKTQFAWSIAPDPLPGSDRGNALFNAHTWPDGSALGNRLLAQLHEGDRIIVRGDTGKLCYRVTDRVEVSEYDKGKRYYATKGRPQIAIVACSGKRLGPGHWTKRTIWYASPIP